MAEGPEWTPADVADAVRIGVNAGRAVERRDVLADVADDFEAIFDHLDAGNVSAAMDHAAYCAKVYRAKVSA